MPLLSLARDDRQSMESHAVVLAAIFRPTSEKLWFRLAFGGDRQSKTGSRKEDFQPASAYEVRSYSMLYRQATT